jgi:hypothetical protein
MPDRGGGDGTVARFPRCGIEPRPNFGVSCSRATARNPFHPPIMKAHTASLVNALVLIGMGLWGYLASETPSMTALIPVIGGTLLLPMTPGIRNENKVVAHVAVVLTLVLLLGLFMPLKGAFERSDNMAVMRVALMLATSVLAMVAFIRSFIAARRRRESGAA